MSSYNYVTDCGDMCLILKQKHSKRCHKINEWHDIFCRNRDLSYEERKTDKPFAYVKILHQKSQTKPKSLSHFEESELIPIDYRWFILRGVKYYPLDDALHKWQVRVPSEIFL